MHVCVCVCVSLSVCVCVSLSLCLCVFTRTGNAGGFGCGAQAMKFHGTRYVEVVRAAGSASQAKVTAAHPGALQYLREDWPDVKDAAMLRALVKLFAGDTDNVQRLMLTGEQRLVYSSSSAYWGVGADGRSGQNRVGQLLMQLRASFKDGSCPKDGVCTACRTADCWVSPLAALTVPYCSPACRKALGLPEEPGKPAWEEEKRVEAERVAEAHAEATAAMVPPATTKAGAAAGAGGTPR